MNWKLRPMAEAPLNEQVLVIDKDGMTQLCVFPHAPLGSQWEPTKGFITVADLLRAATFLAAITPDGYEYDRGCGLTEPLSSGKVARQITFRKIAPPVRYEWIAEGERRDCRIGDWVWADGKWTEIRSDNWPAYGSPGKWLCARRVEVKP